MSKEYEKVRVQVKKQYEDKLKDLSRLKTIEKGYIKLKEENDSLKTENAQLREWVDRMLEYCDMDESALEEKKMDLELKKRFGTLLNFSNAFRL